MRAPPWTSLSMSSLTSRSYSTTSADCMSWAARSVSSPGSPGPVPTRNTRPGPGGAPAGGGEGRGGVRPGVGGRGAAARAAARGAAPAPARRPRRNAAAAERNGGSWPTPCGRPAGRRGPPPRRAPLCPNDPAGGSPSPRDRTRSRKACRSIPSSPGGRPLVLGAAASRAASRQICEGAAARRAAPKGTGGAAAAVRARCRRQAGPPGAAPAWRSSIAGLFGGVGGCLGVFGGCKWVSSTFGMARGVRRAAGGGGAMA
jgi:hypothetical protein